MKHGPEGDTHPTVCPDKAGTDAHRAAIQAMDGAKVEGQTPAGREWSMHPAYQRSGPFYPQLSTHLWGAFAMLAIERNGQPVVAVEAGGYNDLEAVDPYTGRHLWAGRVFAQDRSVYDSLRLLVDAMESAGFLDQTDQERNDPDNA